MSHQREFDRLRRTFAGQLDRWPDVFSHIDAVRRSEAIIPAADIEESDEAYLIDVELPGMKRDDISIEVSGQRLVVNGERRERERIGLLRHRTRTVGTVRFEVSLPLPVEPDGVTATLDSGVLRVTVPKSEPARRRRIPVVVATS